MYEAYKNALEEPASLPATSRHKETKRESCSAA